MITTTAPRSSDAATSPRTPKGLPGAALIIALYLLGGCTQELSIRVELMDFPPEHRDFDQMRAAHDAYKMTLLKRYGEAGFSTPVLHTQLALTERWTQRAAAIISEVCREHYYGVYPQADRAADKWKVYFEQSYGTLFRDWTDLGLLSEAAGQLRNSFELATFAGDAIALLNRADSLADERLGYLLSDAPDQAIAAFQKRKIEARALKAMQDIARHPDRAMLQKNRASAAPKLEYGGFATPSIFEINPGNEALRFVLQLKPISPPLSEVHVVAGGKSTAIIVQESPGQFRVRSVSNDPTKLIQNAVFVTDMVLRAAAQFAGVP